MKLGLSLCLRSGNVYNATETHLNVQSTESAFTELTLSNLPFYVLLTCFWDFKKCHTRKNNKQKQSLYSLSDIVLVNKVLKWL